MQHTNILKNIDDSSSFSKIRSRLLQDKSVHISGVYGSFIGALLMALHAEFEEPLWVICANDEEALQVFCDMTVWSKTEMGFYPSLLGDVKESAGDRAQALRLLRQSTPMVMVTSYAALSEGVIDPDQFEEHTIFLQANKTLKKQSFLRDLVDAGYQHVEMVDVPGEFAARGGIVDIFPLGAIDPVRIEFFGDEIEQLCSFDLRTQGAKEKLKDLVLEPSWELWGQTFDNALKFSDLIPKEAMAVMKEPMYVQQAASKRNDDFLVEDFWQGLDVAHKVSLSLITPEGEWAEEFLTLPVHATEILDHNAAALRRNLDYWTGP